MQFIKSTFIAVLCITITATAQQDSTEQKKRPDFVLVFTKTSEYRHSSITAGVKVLRELGRKNNFIVIRTESSEDFTERNLKNYGLVVFMSTTGDVLDANEQGAFENYIKSGGSYLGVHAAADTEYDWAWYGKLVGGYFNSHPNDPNVRKAVVQRVVKDHPSTKHLPDSWTRNDEWYNYKQVNTNATVLLNLDESSYEGGTQGANHPIAWCHEFDGGRAFYTGGGHTDQSFMEPDFKQHLLGAVQWCLGR